MLKVFLILLPYVADLAAVDGHNVRNVFHIFIVEGSILGEFEQLVKNLSVLTACEIYTLA